MAEKPGIFFNEQVQELIDSFAYCFRVKITVYSAEMEELIVGLQNPGAEFCRIIQKNPRLRRQCLRQDKTMCVQSGAQRSLVSYRCHAGLTETAVPIALDGTIIAYGMLGQFRTGKALPEETVRVCSTGGIGPESLKKAFFAQPYFDKPAMDNMLKLFSMLISYIVTREYVRVSRPSLAETIVRWIEDHISEPTDLNAVSRAMRRSRSTISHSVKKQLGLSFRELSISKKIQRFESIIRASPELPIREAARMVGYDDPLYFSRLYKKVRLVPPSEYARSVKEEIR